MPALITPSRKGLYLAQKLVPSFAELTINILLLNQLLIYRDEQFQNNKINRMSCLLSEMLCPKGQKATLVCISSNCQNVPFQCLNSGCLCSSLHFKCQAMQLQAVSDYLVNWKEYVGKDAREFMARVERIYSNIKSWLERELKLFHSFCKDLFLGKDYSKLIYLIEKEQKKSITSQLFSSSLKNITQPSCTPFSSFTHSQMQNIDELTNQLIMKVECLYKSKELKGLEGIKRCNSVVLDRQHKNNKAKETTVKEKPHLQQSIMSLKLDLTFPRSINSKIVSEATFINKILAKKVKKYHLACRASQCKFSVAEFYKKVAAISKQLKQESIIKKKASNLASLILLKTQFGKVMGGYTPINWQLIKQNAESDEESINPEKQTKSPNKLRSDPTASTVIFSLDLMQKYSLNKPDEAIYCGKKSIGFGNGDLKIVQRGDENRKNYCKFPVSFNYVPKPYLNWSKSGMELSGSRHSVFFKLIEWETFILQY